MTAAPGGRARFPAPSFWRGVVLCLSLVLSAGCATQARTPPTEYDPLEPVNRAIYRFNDVADTYVLRPVARGYEWLLPQFARTGVNNFFDNLNEPRHVLNNLLQGKPREGLSDAARLALNSTLGLGGLLDPASAAGLKRHNEDLGQTLGVWNVPAGPYLVVPFFGPRTTRHAVGSIGDWLYHPQRWLFPTDVRDKVNILWYVHTRSTLLGVDDEIERAFDEYAFVRDAYYQNREFLLYDGEMPEQDYKEDFEADFEEFEEFEEF